MDTQTKKTIAIGVTLGALVGAGLAVLLAPQPGQNGRTKLADVAELVKEKGAILNEKGQVFAEKGQEVAEVIKESLGVIKEIKDEALNVTEDIKTEIQNFKQDPTTTQYNI